MSRTVRWVLLLAWAAGVAPLGGCATGHVGVTPPKGFIFTLYRAPMSCQLDRPEGAPCPANLKHGTTSVHAFVLPVPETQGVLSAGWGNAALDKAAGDAGIHTVYYADYELLEVLGIYKRVTVYVYGE